MGSDEVYKAHSLCIVTNNLLREPILSILIREQRQRGV